MWKSLAPAESANSYKVGTNEPKACHSPSVPSEARMTFLGSICIGPHEEGLDPASAFRIWDRDPNVLACRARTMAFLMRFANEGETRDPQDLCKNE